MTKRYKNLKNLFLSLSLIATFVPVGFYTIKAFIEGAPVEKFSMGIFFIVAVIFTAINILFRKHFRSVIWLIMLGIYICLDNIMTLLIMVAICTILDEFIFTPLYRKFKGLYIINKEIDKR